MTTMPYVVLHGSSSSLILDCTGNAPALLYWGSKLNPDLKPETLSILAKRQTANGAATEDLSITLSPTDGEGFMGQTALRVHRNGQSWGVYTQIVAIEQPDPQRVIVTSADKNSQVSLIHEMYLEPESNVVSTSTKIINDGEQGLTVDWCASATFGIPPQYSDVISYEGRWAKEFQLRRQKQFVGTHVKENRKGRTSHDSFPGLLLAEGQCDDLSGQVYGFHLGWSGNHRLCVEQLYDGRALVQMGELLFPGEIILGEKESYQSPIIYGLHSQTGLNGISQGYHHFVRNHILTSKVKQKERPIHFNTWEALYFDHSMEALSTLVKQAANVGAERFVLDDGWFRHRRSDNAGLGDWYVEETIYPEGLGPLIKEVTSGGMEFGLWVEPEMVNPDSDLYREHPDWILQVPGVKPVEFRNQFVLDFSRQEVTDYLFERMDSLLKEYDISYLKWDMNRDIHQPGNHQGRASINAQTLALYNLIQRLRQEHPDVEIESCASGGARADFGILRYTDRLWTSDSNDALDRLSIQQGLSLFFPPEVMGSHIGPQFCHITGRQLDLDLRAGTALFGHMGMEVNLSEFNERQVIQLKNALDLHKKFRPLLHSGNLVRFKLNDFSHSFGVVSESKDEALYSYTETGGYPRHLPGQFFFHGLDEAAQYRLEIVWPSTLKTPMFENVMDHIKDQEFSGEVLRHFGLQLPILMPESVLIIHATKV